MSERAATDAEIVRAKSMAEAGFGGIAGNVLSLIARIEQERDAALAEGAVLREALGLVDSDLLEWHTRYALVGLQPMFELIGRCRQHIDYARGEVPLVSAHLAEVERLRRVERAYKSEWNHPGPVCTCHEAYADRGLVDPDCFYHKSPALFDALAALEGGENG